MLATVTKKTEKEWICPDDWRTITQAAEELEVDRSRVVKITKETLPGGAPRLPTREFFGVQVIHVDDLERVRVRLPGRPGHLKAVKPPRGRRRRP